MRRAITTALLATIFMVPSALAQTPSEGGYSSTPIVVPPGGSSEAPGGGAVDVLGESTTAPGSGGSQGDSEAAGLPAAEVTPTRSAEAGGSLPFTGLDLGLVVALAAGLLGLGVVLRRTTARQSI